MREPLKGCRWLLVKPAEKLTPEEQEKLNLALQASPELARCYELKQEFLRIYETKRVERAQKRLRAWMAKVEAFGQRALLAFVQTLRNWWTEVVAYFRHRVTNAAAEGLNTKIKLVLRRAFGFRNHESFRIRVKRVGASGTNFGGGPVFQLNCLKPKGLPAFSVREVQV